MDCGDNTVEKKQANDVGSKAERSYHYDELWV
jgi:hypothetical protein